MPSSTVMGSTWGAKFWNIVGSRWPPVGEMAWPAGTTRGPSTQPEVDGLLEGDVEEDAAGLHEQAEVAHGREAGPQRALAVGHGPQRAHGRVLLHGDQRAAVVGPAHEQVDLHVHEPGQQGDVAEVERRRRRRGPRSGRPRRCGRSCTSRSPGSTITPADDVEHAGATRWIGGCGVRGRAMVRAPGSGTETGREAGSPSRECGYRSSCDRHHRTPRPHRQGRRRHRRRPVASGGRSSRPSPRPAPTW